MRCPLLYALKHYYKVADPTERSISYLWGEALADMFLWIHRELSDKTLVSWDSTLRQWEKVWSQTITTHGYDAIDGFELYNRGARHLLEIFKDIPENTHVVGFSYPCRRTVGEFELLGNVDVIRVTETPGKGRSGRTAQVIAIDRQGTRKPTKFDVRRRIDYLLIKYGLENELRRDLYRAAHETTTWVYQPKVPALHLLPIDDGMFKQAMQWMDNVFEAIRLGLFYPRMAGHCHKCSYQKACDMYYISNRALASPEQTAEDVRRKIDAPPEA